MQRLLLIPVLVLACSFSQAVRAETTLNVLLYHNVSERTPFSSSVTPAQFREHLEKLHQGGFQVVSLPQAITALRTDQPLPARAVAITFDDADESIYYQAFPLLQEFGYPFTIFVQTEPVDRRFGRAVRWDMLREMQAAGATIANHTTEHGYLVRAEQHDEDWLQATLADIDHAQQRLQAELGQAPKLFAYPYGEYNQALQAALATRGWVAFGQQSGGISAQSDFTALPRFAAAGRYAQWGPLRTKLNSRPLPVDYTQLPDPVVRDDRLPELTLTLTDTSDVRTRDLRCYIQGKTVIPQWTADAQFSVRAEKPLGKGRHRFNCTAPARQGNFYYWLSHQWIRY